MARDLLHGSLLRDRRPGRREGGRRHDQLILADREVRAGQPEHEGKPALKLVGVD
jgi:hypothetical protein